MSTFLQYPPSGGGGGSSSTTLDPASSASVIQNFDDFDSYNYSAGSPSTTAVGPMHLTFAMGAIKGTPTGSETNRVGIMTATGNTSNQFPGCYGDFTSILVAGLTNHTFATSVNFSRIPTSGADSWLGQWGIQDTSTAYNNSGNAITLRVTYLSPNFVGQCTNAGTTTFLDTGIPYAANTWYNLRVVTTPTQVTYYINGVSVGSITTNIPATNPMGPVNALTWQAGADIAIKYDWIYQSYQLAVSRGSF